MLAELLVNIELLKPPSNKFEIGLNTGVILSAASDLISTEHMLKSNSNSYETNPLGQTLDKRIGLKLIQSAAFAFILHKSERCDKPVVKWSIRLLGLFIIGKQIQYTLNNLEIAKR